MGSFGAMVEGRCCRGEVLGGWYQQWLGDDALFVDCNIGSNNLLAVFGRTITPLFGRLVNIVRKHSLSTGFALFFQNYQDFIN